ncbi:RNA polymerase sigma factor [Sphingomonas sp. KR3-1]|uniref:RNA polymerase sigma factor n=1 Tax=Sphingomonas sp. KR3-1 TaxID=3156611 RepID=UPI0032B46FAA
MGRNTHDISHSTLALEAGPVRRWLSGYFHRRVRDHDEVEDLVQDVFTRIVARDSEEAVGHLGGYVMRTAASVLADRARRRAVRQADLHIVHDGDRHGDDALDPERVLSGKQDLHAATAALLSLPERTRTVFVLRRLEGQRHADIARHLGISISAVEKHMVRAMRHLSAEMEKRDGA